MSTRRVVLITLAAVAAVLIVLVAGLGGAIGYKREHDRRVKSERLTEKLRAELIRAEDGAAERRVAAVRQVRESSHTEGYNFAFCCFGPWRTGRYYVVRIEKGTDGREYEMVSRTRMERCLVYLWEGDDLFTRDDC